MDGLREVLTDRLFEPDFWVGLGVLGVLLGQGARVVVAGLVARSVARARGDGGPLELDADPLRAR